MTPLAHHPREVQAPDDPRHAPIVFDQDSAYVHPEGLLGGSQGLLAEANRTLSTAQGLVEPLRAFAESGRPVLGTCAGAILLAKRGARELSLTEIEQPILDIATHNLKKHGIEYCDRTVSMYDAAGRAVAKMQA